uniref:Oligomycin sensitivity conferral protein n=2 Tax=Esox lucius TaxID=8010 RepID=A0A3P8Z4X5_ESOLU
MNNVGHGIFCKKKYVSPAQCLTVFCHLFMSFPARRNLLPRFQVYGVEGRNATALFSAAGKQDNLEQVEKELVTVSVRHKKLSGIMANPHVKRSIKQRTFTDTLTKKEMSPIIVNLINVMADNGRLTLTSDVLSAFSKMSVHRGEVFGNVTTAQPLDAANLQDLKVALSGFLAKGETLKLESKSDPSILGGMIVSIGDKYVDMSTKTKIQKLTKIIRET